MEVWKQGKSVDNSLKKFGSEGGGAQSPFVPPTGVGVPAARSDHSPVQAAAGVPP